MAIRTFHKRLAAPAAAILLVAAGCSSPAGPSQNGVVVAGSWSGTALLPNAYTATMTLQQNGTAVSGTMRISAIGEHPVTGTVSSGNRTFAWRINYNCEVWTGTLTVAADGREMDGPLAIDRTGCAPAQNSGAGTLALDKR